MKLIASITWLFAVILSLFALVPFSEAKPATQELNTDQHMRPSRNTGRRSNAGLRRKRSRSGHGGFGGGNYGGFGGGGNQGGWGGGNHGGGSGYHGGWGK
ncbi:glycine rich protein family domain-containing protein [Ditylenchus destructor]|nr:glycine rich protein family domain-containing protein [Ditylenchus destructor]